MKKIGSHLFWALKIIAGCAIFALGFDLFLEPYDFNAGGISGIAMAICELIPFGTVGGLTAMINLPLFIIGGKKIGLKFFVGSLIGAFFFSLFIDLFTVIPVPQSEPLLGALYGGLLCGAGLGIVFVCQASTGGTDIMVRLLKQRYRNMPIGQISLALDLFVAALTGIVFQDMANMLYSLVTMFVTSQIVDAVVYRFDYSKVALIISKEHERVARAIAHDLQRGVTYLYGQGYYSKADTKVILTAVKKNQLSELKELVVHIDPNAFIIVQEAHQVLGDGFARYTKESL